MKGKVTVNRVYYKYQTQTFNASSSFQIFNVPQGTKKLIVDCVASKGADNSGTGGSGGRVECVLPVTGGQALYFYVGTTNSDFNVPEYNASDIRTDNTGVTNSASLSSRLVVAGGGGSGGSSHVGTGGAGGGLEGGEGTGGSSGRGKGGTQTEGGAAGAGASSTSSISLINAPGEFGLGGIGLYRTRQGEITDKYSGAGGAGWYGGGGGGRYTSGSSTSYLGGGGGSSYTDPTCFNITHTQGYNAGTGYITIVYPLVSTESDYDFYEDIYESVKVVEVEESGDTKFYGIKEYKRGQYYGN